MAVETDQEATEKEFMDLSYIRDLVDIIKNKTMFFFPFFGAFLVFLYTKSDYVANTNWFLKLLFLVCFGFGVFYAWVASNALHLFERIRLLYGINRITKGDFFTSATIEQRNAIADAMKSVADTVTFEDKIYRRTMYLLYIVAGTLLFELYLSPPLAEWLPKLARWSLPPL